MSHTAAIASLAFIVGVLVGALGMGAVVHCIAKWGRDTRLALERERWEHRGEVWMAWDRDRDPK